MNLLDWVSLTVISTAVIFGASALYLTWKEHRW